MFCPKCGEKNPDGAKFCAKCGSPLPAFPATDQAPSPSLPRKRARVLLVIALSIVAVTVVAAVTLVVPRLMGGGAEDERLASNASLGNGAAVSVDGCAYFYSSEAGGICRAGNDGSECALIRPNDGGSLCSFGVASDGDVPYFATANPVDYSVPVEVRAMRLDGTGERVVWTVPQDDVDENYRSVAQLRLLGNDLYAITVDSLLRDNMTYYRLYRLAGDGSGAEMLFEFPSTSDMLLLSNGLYSVEEGPSTGRNTVVVRDLGSGEARALYASPVKRDASISMLCMANGRLLFSESDYNAGVHTLVSTTKDGDDRRELYQVSSPQSFTIAAATSEGIYLSVYDFGDMLATGRADWELVCASPDDKAAQPLLSGRGSSIPQASDLGDRLLLFGMDGGEGASPQVMSMSYDGSNQIAYQLPGR